MSEPNTPAGQRKGSFWRTVRAVAWSFVGIRKRSGYQEDLAKLNPFHLIAVGIAAAVVLVLALIVLVNWVVTK